jgi:hypothetical protein
VSLTPIMSCGRAPPMIDITKNRGNLILPGGLGRLRILLLEWKAPASASLGDAFPGFLLWTGFPGQGS